MNKPTQKIAVARADKNNLPSKLEFPVVGIGASAGGVQALTQLLEILPPNTGMAFVVVMHLSPTHESALPEVLQRATSMPVIKVDGPIQIERNHVYAIPPDRQLLMNDGYLTIAELNRPLGQQVAIDIFFRSLAQAHQERAIAVVLSGAGSDGAAGVRRIRELGGISITQHPDQAEHSGMPTAAIATGVVDFILPLTEIPQKLVELWANARAIELPPTMDDDAAHDNANKATGSQSAEEALLQVIALLRTQTGHDFRHYKRATILRRIERRLLVRGVPNLPTYRDLLESDPQEHVALLRDMLIGVTNFFRDHEAFEVLENDILPDVFRGKKSDEAVRVWVAACSTGEEAYSMAMLLEDRASQLATPPQIQVFASDIDDRAINTARGGVYPASIITDVSAERLQRYFTMENDRYRVRKQIRDKVLFASHNLLRDPPFSRLDIICCRNLLIYLNREMQRHVLELFHFSLNPGGILFLGSSESADVVANLFAPIDKKNRIYRAKPLSRSSRYMPNLPRDGRARTFDSSVPIPADKPQFSFAEIHQRVLAQYAAPSVIVNYDYDIVHMSDRVGRFLRHIGGEPSRNLVSLVHPELRLELRTALFQAIQSKQSVEARRVQLSRDDRSYFVNMIVRPFRDAEAGADFLLVMFDEVEQTMRDAAEAGAGEKKDAVLTQLETELQRTKEQLQETIEHAEVSTEELRASNEELQAINEELRSATEELETSKEELQSVNEELVTVNYELKAKVEETSKVNDDLNNLIASTEIATIFVDKGMRIKRCTPRASDIFNIIPSDTDRPLLDITHRLNYPSMAEDVASTFETLRPVEREVRSNDGRYYIVRLLPYRTTDDRIEGAIMTFFDITSRRQAEEQLRVGEERMRLVAESMEDYAIMTLDADGLITSWNRGAQHAFGYAENEVLGQPIELIFVPEDREKGVPAEERRQAQEQGRAEDERWHLRKDGSRIYCSGVMTPLRHGGAEGYAKIARDQTARIRAETLREAALTHEHISRTEAEMASAMKDEFLAIMSHELRNPLNLVYMNAELLSRLPEIAQSELGAKATEMIRGAVQSQSKIIEDLLDLSRIKTGKLALTVTSLDLVATTHDILDSATTDPAAGERQISVAQDSAASLVVQADRVRIEQVLLNLLDNAIKFTVVGGKITIKLSDETDMARIDIVDNGYGIAPEFLPHIFDMFGQVGPLTSRGGGLGIGLALVRQIVELHGGRIEAASAGIDRGSRFSVWLPKIFTPILAAPPAKAIPARKLDGRRILLVDDIEDTATSFQYLLEFEGAQVKIATTAKDALKILDNHPIDLMLSDIAMPDMDGYQLMQEIRKNPKHAALRTIAISGLGRPEEAERAHAAGYAGYIGKPVAMEKLLLMIADISSDKANL